MPTTKYITDMTDEEILALTEDDLKRIIQLKMLEEGIKLLARPEEPTYADVPKKDVAGFQVKVGYGTDNFLYASREVAQRIADTIWGEADSLRKREYVNYGGSYEYTLTPYETYPEIAVEEIRFYSPTLFAQVRGTLEANKRLKDAYDKQLKEYNENEESAAWIRDEVNNRHYAIVSKHRDLEATLTKFKEYLELAEYDVDRATRFFDKAYSPDRETQEYLNKKTDGAYALPVEPEKVEPEPAETTA